MGELGRRVCTVLILLLVCREIVVEHLAGVLVLAEDLHVVLDVLTHAGESEELVAVSIGWLLHVNKALGNDTGLELDAASVRVEGCFQLLVEKRIDDIVDLLSRWHLHFNLLLSLLLLLLGSFPSQIFLFLRDLLEELIVQAHLCLLSPGLDVRFVKLDEHFLVRFAEKFLLLLVDDNEHGGHAWLCVILTVVRVDEEFFLDLAALILVNVVGQVGLSHIIVLLLRQLVKVRFETLNLLMLLLDRVLGVLDFLLEVEAENFEVLVLLEMDAVPLEGA